MNTENILIPFLTWAGGKRWFVQKYNNILPKTYNRYIEPFLGGGSVFFYLKPKQAILGDINSDLITTYKMIRKNYKKINELLLFHQSLHSKEYYYKIRETVPSSDIELAARFIYLNRTCFNGIYRVNHGGKFNVPKGTKNNVILDSDNFESLSELLQNASIKKSDFEKLIDSAKKGDLIFADPPYTVRHNNNGFIGYNEKLFSWDDQIRLANALMRAKDRGVQIVATNANHESIRELYKDRSFDFDIVSRYSSISSTKNSRKQYEELIIKEY
ncbi:Dam family site-specific DNA-(adenine-N6)-methyltransferase [Francisella philomiragia]|uniref:Site-specific DNA-methyltransferase (adenine-specific) n=1 Tax=Francisella philomiragia TaxID=28110 RepID=A0AAW3D7D3_9GAMM|nr:Dam family site-specific DNA-(adenine-N6)-methyltransferase [Francisella philomiragia]KFJ41906.1 DNA adenine methylase family protein [Francisella philomiragia]MBK2254631.1 Dam family site-specific DNA-(adenine-N6)-methyltransferase [Francisella philomiragia]MBK2273012.1 Dam family site-specific DNA-(adenine-N6)-methyltransferase [Francisella philomiragia]MBK2276853.1 Dam family site-specific DNA-(adenine-N6)-methyltransferase [Francisella philomiragia]MBK2280565.1 Dam family site-specific 